LPSPKNPVSTPGKTLSPNRTIDDSPVTEDRGRQTDLRDPLKAPGQLPPFARRKTHLDADESYGSTEIPERTTEGVENAPGSNRAPKRGASSKSRSNGRKPGARKS
jgi:hypothetical protein